MNVQSGSGPAGLRWLSGCLIPADIPELYNGLCKRLVHIPGQPHMLQHIHVPADRIEIVTDSRAGLPADQVPLLYIVDTL